VPLHNSVYKKWRVSCHLETSIYYILSDGKIGYLKFDNQEYQIGHIRKMGTEYRLGLLYNEDDWRYFYTPVLKIEQLQ